jgi:hypothetical protein
MQKAAECCENESSEQQQKKGPKEDKILGRSSIWCIRVSVDIVYGENNYSWQHEEEMDLRWGENIASNPLEVGAQIPVICPHLRFNYPILRYLVFPALFSTKEWLRNKFWNCAASVGGA